MKFYMHKESGNVENERTWKYEYDNMDVESWHGCEAKDANPENWIEDGHLIEVKKINGEWTEV